MSDEYFINGFRQKFCRLNDNKIVLYGTGYYTKVILDNFRNELNIVGVVDDSQVGKIVYGINVWDIQTAVNNCDIIIIVCNLSVGDLIFQRIKSYTEKKKVEVYYTNGEKPAVYDYDSIKTNNYWNNTEEDLYNLIKKHDVISFDIYDTIITRNKVTPESVFEQIDTYINEITGKKVGFAEKHKQAEHESYKQHKYFDIELIYKYISGYLGWDQSFSDLIMKKEIEIETLAAVPRNYALKLIRYVKNCICKKVILISDMYLHTVDIERILLNCGLIRGKDYDDLFVSCDVNHSKYIGDIYEYIKSYYHNSSLLHIGDNYFSDVKMANANGIDSYWLKSPKTLLVDTGLEKVIGEAIALPMLEQKGLYITRMFDYPFGICKNGGKIFIENMFEFGYIFIGPILAYFTYWLVTTATKLNIQKLLFIARDGFLMKQAFDKISAKFCCEVEGIYFLTSRRASSVACISNTDDIRFIVNNLCKVTSLSFSEILDKAFGVKVRSNDFRTNIKHYEMGNEELYRAILDYSEEIFTNSANEMCCYKKYISKLNIENVNNLGFVNLCGRGVTQHYIDILLKKRTIGLYWATEPEIHDIYGDVSNVYTAFGSDESQHLSVLNIVKRFLFLEAIFTAPYGCLKRFDEKCQPIYENDVSSSITEILECHKGALDYLDELTQFPDKKYSDKLFGAFYTDNIILSDKIVECFTYKDVYGVKEIRKLM